MAKRVTSEVRSSTVGKQVPFTSASLTDDFYIPGPDFRGSQPTLATTEPARLVAPRLAAQPKTGLPSWIGWIGWGVAGAGGGLAAYSYVAGQTAVSNYLAAKTTADIKAARSDATLANSLYYAGMGALATGALTGVLALIFPGSTGGTK